MANKFRLFPWIGAVLSTCGFDTMLDAFGGSCAVSCYFKPMDRGVFTVAGDPSRYDEGRRDLRLGLDEHFVEQSRAHNHVFFDNGTSNRTMRSDVFDYDVTNNKAPDLVLLDPSSVPRSDDNGYVKRYHFVEGLSSYWGGLDILVETRVKKTPKKELLTARLKSGRGSAIKAQHRGRALEDHVEGIVKNVFSPGVSIEAESFGATGSKQTNTLGDVNDIIREGRHDTVLLLIADGVTRSSRESHLQNLHDEDVQGARRGSPPTSERERSVRGMEHGVKGLRHCRLTSSLRNEPS